VWPGRGKYTYARETFTDELPLDPPETVEAARVWLSGKGIPSGDRLERAVHRAMCGKLLPSDIEKLKAEAA